MVFICSGIEKTLEVETFDKLSLLLLTIARHPSGGFFLFSENNDAASSFCELDCSVFFCKIDTSCVNLEESGCQVCVINDKYLPRGDQWGKKSRWVKKEMINIHIWNFDLV